MAYVILGLLMLWPQSLYELTKSFEAGVSLFYSSSTGSIKRALDRLLADDMIKVESEGGPRGKRIYAPTDTGRTEFRTWMLEESHKGNPETSMLARTYFLGLLPPEERQHVVDSIRRQIQAGLAELEQVEELVLAADVPEHFSDVARYQMATLQYGLISHRSALTWAKKYLQG
ncbi:MAG: PadR family transcriptional regulator [Actinomycetaceae bacterium]|nr:PadR family transcriptional regulator [Actinomycetaceae bacterium]